MAAMIEFDLMIDWISNDLWLKHYSAQIFLTVRWISHCFAFTKTVIIISQLMMMLRHNLTDKIKIVFG